MKKAELAVLAERQVDGTSWLPAPLSFADVATEQSADAEIGSPDEDDHPEAAE